MTRLPQRGFTLIELMVSMTIVMILSGAALATFLNFQARRQAQDDAAVVADRLRTIQIKATAVEVPSGCINVDNYSVSLDGADLVVTVNCLEGGSVVLPELALTLANSVVDNGPLTVVFDSQTVSASPVTIDVCGNTNLYQITVNAAANVGRPVFIEGGC